MGGGQVVGQLSLASSAPLPPPPLYLTMSTSPHARAIIPRLSMPKKSSLPFRIITFI